MPCFGGCGPEFDTTDSNDANDAPGTFPYVVARAALAGVNVSKCRADGGPTGVGHVRVTFVPKGEVQSVLVDRAPFAGSAVGDCIALEFATVHVPAFTGNPVAMGGVFLLR